MKRFFSYCGVTGEYFRHDTAEQARASAEGALDLARDDAASSEAGWDEGVGDTCWGELRGVVVHTTTEPAADGSPFDEVWEYELQPVAEVAS